jgi:hypothetical protein
MASASEPKLPQRNQEVPPRRGENIDEDKDREDKDKKEERDKVPDTPPTEPKPVPVEEPPRTPDKRGPFIVHEADAAFFIELGQWRLIDAIPPKPWPEPKPPVPPSEPPTTPVPKPTPPYRQHGTITMQLRAHERGRPKNNT